MLPNCRSDAFELLLDFAETFDVFRMRNEFSLVLVMSVFRELSLSTHVVLRGKLRVAGALVSCAQRHHLVFENLAFLLEVDTSVLNLAMKFGILGAGSREVGRERVKTFA